MGLLFFVLNGMGVITCKNGEIDVALEYVYANSFSDTHEGKKKPMTLRRYLIEHLQNSDFRDKWIQLHQDPKSIQEFAEAEGISYDEARDFLKELLDDSLDEKP